MSREVSRNSNPWSQDHLIIVGDESSTTSRNNIYSYKKFPDLIPDGDKKSQIRLCCSVGTVILFFLLVCYVFSLMYSVEEDHAVLQTKNGTVHHSRIITYTNGNHTNTTRNPLIDLDICLKNIRHPFEGIHGTDKCLERPVKERLLIFIQEADSEISTCLLSDEGSCNQQLHNEMQRFINMGFTHVNDDFYIGGDGRLYEGRPLTCHFYESDKAWDTYGKPMYIVIPSCDRLYPTKTKEKSQFNFVLKNLFACLEKQGLLTKSYTIHIPEICKHYFDYTILGDYKKNIIEYPPTLN